MSFTDDYGFEWQQPTQNSNRPTRFITFEVVAEKDDVLSDEAGRPVHKDVHYVRIQNAGSRDELHNRVAMYLKQNPKDDEVKEGYRKWKEREQRNVIEGTPLKELPFLGRSEVADFNALNIFSAEQLANLPDSAKHRFHNINHIIEKVRAFLDFAKDTQLATKQAAVINDQNERIALLERTIKEMGTRLDGLKAKASPQ
jgi:hypothetical protein